LTASRTGLDFWRLRKEGTQQKIVARIGHSQYCRVQFPLIQFSLGCVGVWDFAEICDDTTIDFFTSPTRADHGDEGFTVYQVDDYEGEGGEDEYRATLPVLISHRC